MESTKKKPCCCCSAEEPAADTVSPADVPDAVPSCCRHKDRSPEEYKALVNRLSRIEGQVRGVRGMLEKDAYCVDILVQVAAVNSALNSFAKELLAQHMSTCVADDLRAGIRWQRRKAERVDQAAAPAHEVTLRQTYWTYQE